MLITSSDLISYFGVPVCIYKMQVTFWYIVVAHTLRNPSSGGGFLRVIKAFQPSEESMNSSLLR